MHFNSSEMTFSNPAGAATNVNFPISPDRWADLPENARAPKHPGFANMMSFSFGPQSCLGWKFTLLEAKVFLAVLLPHFVFTSAARIVKSNAILTRPYVFGEREKGERLPIGISRYHPA